MRRRVLLLRSQLGRRPRRPLGDEHRVVAKSAVAPRFSRNAARPRTAHHRLHPPPNTSAHAETNAAPRRSSGTSLSCASSSAGVRRILPVHTRPTRRQHTRHAVQRVDFQPGVVGHAWPARSPGTRRAPWPPRSPRTSRPSPAPRRTGRRRPTTTTSAPRYPRRRAPAAVRPASCGCGWPPAARSTVIPKQCSTLVGTRPGYRQFTFGP